jgi:retinol dehydrogenase 12
MISGVMNAPWEPKTKQGFEMHWVRISMKSTDGQGTNVLGPFLFTKELLPVLLSTAKRFPEATRVIWVSSIAHIGAPKSIINFDDVSLPTQSGWTRYSQSKAV